MKPFLLIQSRPENETSDDEYSAFGRYMNIDLANLVRLRIEQTTLPDIDLDDYSGVLVGGGPFNFTSTDKSPVQRRIEREMHGLLDQIIERDFPFFGACYGIGLLTSHQGGVMSRRYSEPVGPATIQRLASDPLLDQLDAPFVSLLGHKEACEVLPAGATLLASSETCPVQMFRIGSNVYATQFHPELDSSGLATRIHIYRHHGYFQPEEAEQLIALGRVATVTEPMKLLSGFVARYGR